MPTICVAIGCSNQVSASISLHTFPRDSKRCALWDRFVRLKRADWKKASARSVLCSAHFLQTDFDSSNVLQYQLGFVPKCTRLKDDAVPTIHASTVPVTVSVTRSGNFKSSVKAAPTGPGTGTVSVIVGVVFDEPKSKKSRQSAAKVKLSVHRVGLKLISLDCYLIKFSMLDN